MILRIEENEYYINDEYSNFKSISKLNRTKEIDLNIRFIKTYKHYLMELDTLPEYIQLLNGHYFWIFRNPKIKFKNIHSERYDNLKHVHLKINFDEVYGTNDIKKFERYLKLKELLK
jgi:hypothetical protein